MASLLLSPFVAVGQPAASQKQWKLQAKWLASCAHQSAGATEPMVLACVCEQSNDSPASQVSLRRSKGSDTCGGAV